MTKTSVLIDVQLESGNFGSDYIPPELLGTVFVIGGDSLTGTFGQKVENLGITTIRYPGGGA